MKATGVLIMSDDGKSLLADCRPERIDRDNANTIGDDMHRAMLFAAAPEMLAALKQMERIHDLPRYLKANGHGVIGDIVREVLEASRAAVTKATD